MPRDRDSWQKESDFWRRYYDQLKGATILGTSLDAGHHAVFVVRLANGKEIWLALYADPEGNPGGFLDGLGQPGSEPTVKEVLNDTSTSTWLRNALVGLKGRDPVDAANDAEVLARLARTAAGSHIAVTGTPGPDDKVRYDYDRQAWIINGVVAPCNHPASMKPNCCYAGKHAGERV